MGPGFAARVLAAEMIWDWVREGDVQRRSSSVRAPRTRRIGIRRLGHGLTQGVLAPVRMLHATHREAPQHVDGPRLAA